ncbi:MAG: glycine cleavage T C-terminal barrel domain-containing protein, partial [Candidatus Promineifilaceae bacterium]|nr:glycine cleavage T C-terminal barrel domain-containing protein [Candidatus Promineifilaceae bacterium]
PPAYPPRRGRPHTARGLDVARRPPAVPPAARAGPGPGARAILHRVAQEAGAHLPYYRLTRAEIAGRPVQISRTGYTGDLGYELWMEAADGLAIWDAVTAAGAPYGLLPAGLLALDMARLEAGLLLADVDYRPANKALIDAQSSTPYELGLGWLVDLDKEDYFVGREALAQAKEGGPRWKVVGLEIDWTSLEEVYGRASLPVQVPATPWRESVPLYHRGREIGYATSGCFSPLLKRPIALATVRSDVSTPGTPLEIETTVEHMRRRAEARVVKLPFFDPARKKAPYQKGSFDKGETRDW